MSEPIVNGNVVASLPSVRVGENGLPEGGASRIDWNLPEDGPGGRGRHRAPSRLRRVAGFVGSLVMLVVVLAAGHYFTEGIPGINERHEAFYIEGQMNKPVDGRTFEAVVLGVRGAKSLAEGGFRHDSEGVWVVVKVRLTATTKATTVGYAALRDGSGRTYLESDRFDQYSILGGRQLQPGIPVEGEIAFEVSQAAAGELWLELAKPPLDQRMDAMTRVKLPTDLPTWLAAKDPIRLLPSKVVLP